jgi:hypothetical protein
MHWAGDLDTANILPQDFLRRFFKRVGSERMRRGNKNSGILGMYLCSYHEHATDADQVGCLHGSRNVYGRTLIERLDGTENRT